MFPYMKKTINFIKTFLAKFNLIANLTDKNLALHQQLIVLNRSTKRLRLKTKDRLSWIILYRFWRWKSRSKNPGCPRINQEIRDLIYKIASVNHLWGAPSIHGELLKLGFKISERTVSCFMPKYPRKPSSQTWKTFIKNHMTNTVSIDFSTVPTVTFRILFVIILNNNRRKVVHFNTTEHTTAQ